jgi:hypothetical protein
MQLAWMNIIALKINVHGQTRISEQSQRAPANESQL